MKNTDFKASTESTPGVVSSALLGEHVVCRYRINEEGNRKWVSDLVISSSLGQQEALRLQRMILRPYNATQARRKKDARIQSRKTRHLVS